MQKAEDEISAYITELALLEDVQVTTRGLARFEPVVFDDSVVGLVEEIALSHGHTVCRMPSGAGHDAQMFARVCPTAMVFVPSVDGISHNPAEYTSPEDLIAGTDILLHVMYRLTQTESLV